MSPLLGVEEARVQVASTGAEWEAAVRRRKLQLLLLSPQTFGAPTALQLRSQLLQRLGNDAGSNSGRLSLSAAEAAADPRNARTAAFFDGYA